MEDKQTRLLMWLGAILLALVAVILVIKPSGDKDEDDGDFSKVFPDTEAAAVQSLTLTRGEATATITRSDSGWKMTAPTEIEADARRVDALVDSLVHLEAREPMEGAKAADFGLEPPKVKVEATLDGDKKLTLDIGADTPVGAGTYIRNATGIRATRSKLSTTFDKDPADFRTREIVRFHASEVTRLTLTPQEGEPVVLVSDDHGWWVGADGSLRADDEAVRSFLDSLLDLRVDQFGDGPIAPPAGATRVEVAMGDTTYDVEIGAIEDGKATVVGPVQPGPVIVRVADLPLTRLAIGWASTRLVPVRMATVDSIEIHLGDTPWTAQKSDGTWAPVEGSAVLSAIGEVRVDRARPADAPRAEWGHLTLKEGDTRTETVHLYQEVDGGRVAREEAGGAPFVLPDTELKRLQDATKPAPH